MDKRFIEFLEQLSKLPEEVQEKVLTYTHGVYHATMAVTKKKENKSA